MAVTKTIIKLSNTEAVIRISGVAGDTATIILDSDLLLPLEYLNNDPIQVNIGAVYCAGVKGGYVSLIRNNVTILNVANKSLEPTHLLGEPFVPDSINNTSNIVVTITGQQSQVYIYLKKVSGFTSTDSVIDSAFNVLSLFGAGEQGAWYDPSDFQPNWRRNLLTYSEAIGGTNWTIFGNVGGVCNQNASIAPDGTLTASKFITPSGSAVSTYIGQNITTVAGNFTGSIYLKYAGYQYVQVFCRTILDYVNIDLLSGSVTASSIGTPDIISVGNGWYRVALTSTLGAALNNNSISPIQTGTSGRATTFISDGTSGIYLWGAQLEQSSSASTYQKITDGIQDYYTVQPQPVLFQDSAGTTPVTAVEQPVGLMKDKSGRTNHAFQATAGNRPTLSARVNLLTKTEDFNVSPWVKSNTTIGGTKYTAPNGTLTADKLVESLDVTAVQHDLYQSITATAGVNYTSIIYLKAGELNKIQFQIQITSTASQWTLDFTTGIVTNTYGSWPNHKCSATLQNNGWYKLVFSGDAPTGTTGLLHIFTCNNSGSNNYIGDGVSGTYIWGADLRPTNAGALLPPYQRVNTASDYDTVGFPLYLKANGTSSAMSTNSIDFSSTDKMTVVTGVRKLSDATITVLLEHSAAVDNNVGFGLYPSYNGAGSVGSFWTAGVNAGTVKFFASSGFAAPISGVNTLTSVISTPNNQVFRNNGVQLFSDTTALGNRNFSNHPLYLFARNNGASLWFNGQFYGAIIRGATTDQTSVIKAENLMATKTGITF